MLDPSGLLYSATDWTEGIKPLLISYIFPDDLSIEDLTILDITLPTSQPPIGITGTYTFAIASFKTGTADFVSNLATVSFQVE